MIFFNKKEKYNKKEILDFSKLGTVSHAKYMRICVEPAIQYDDGTDDLLIGVDPTKTLAQRDENGTILLPSKQEIDVYYYPQSFSQISSTAHPEYPYLRYFSQEDVSDYKWEYAYFKSLKEQIENLPEKLKLYVVDGTITLENALKIVKYINRQDLYPFLLKPNLEEATRQLKYFGCFNEDSQERFYEWHRKCNKIAHNMPQEDFDKLDYRIKKL